MHTLRCGDTSRCIQEPYPPYAAAPASLYTIPSNLDLESSLGDAYERLLRIYQMARRQALGVDHAIEAIIAHLNDSLDFEPRRQLSKGN